MLHLMATAATAALLGTLHPSPVVSSNYEVSRMPHLGLIISARGAIIAQMPDATSQSEPAQDQSLPKPQLGDPDPANVPTGEEQQRLRDELFKFIVGEYLGHGRENHRDRPELFAPRVRYYGKGTLSREQVLADKAAYYRRWPQRRYEFVDNSIQAKPGSDDTIAFTFRYNFEVSDGRETRRGIGIVRLGIARIDNSFAIVSEDGQVVRRR